MLKLKNQIKDYAWGSKSLIPEYLGQEPGAEPQAEIWYGAHPDSPSITTAGPLDKVLEQHPNFLTGSNLELEKLPYLVKMLAADSALSLQVHPTKAQAKQGFAFEEKQGISRDASHRNYKDDNHKPELIYALTAFEALCGFRDINQTIEIFTELQNKNSKLADSELFKQLQGSLNADQGIKSTFTFLLNKPTGIEDLVSQCVQTTVEIKGSKYQKEYETIVQLQKLYPGDPGVILSLMLNRVSLKPGQAIFLPAGNVHAYLKGLGIEVMASSDNVLRGGLTPKHMDIAELLEVVEFKATDVSFLETEEDELGRVILHPPFEEFQLQIMELKTEERANIAQNGPTIFLVGNGEVTCESPVESLTLKPGESIFIAHDEAPVTVFAKQQTQAFAVTVNEKS
ncbi:MAG: mannose-6-phosphate isomerase, class I [Micrococcaceae bacterium]